jgi:diguanylate cyclase (GGDEF)-like protein
VVDAGEPVAIIRRHRFLALFTNPYSHSLYAKTPVHRIAEDNMVIGHIEEPLESLSRQLTESGFLEQEDFIITDAFGQYRGMGNILDLLREITALQVRLARHANPLTGLPGNVTIKETIEAWLMADTRFVVAYIDIDHFKPVNDEYGYACGDAVIRVLGQLLETRVAGSSAFAGHIGGDDFVIIAAPEQWQVISDDLFARFTDATEELAAWHAAVSRPTLSIAALEIASGAGLTEAQIAGELSVLKKRAKARHGHSLLTDQDRFTHQSSD